MGRNLVLHRGITVREARAVRMLDLYAWFGAVIVGTAHLGIAVPDIGSPHPWFLANRLEWIEAGIFLLLVALQIRPILIFRGWYRYLVRDQAPWYTDRQHDSLVWIGRIQIALAMALPLLPPLIHQGIGLPH